jgi:hypothetical protein
MRGLYFEMVAELVGIAELFVLEQTPGADVAERACQLIVMGLAARQTVVINKDPQFSLAQRRTVKCDRQ